MKLKLSDMSNVADVVSAIAIVISLVYVGLQVSDNTKATRSSTANGATALTVSAYSLISSSAESASVFHRGMRDPSLLDDGERTQFIFMVHTAFLSFQNSYYLSKEGTLDDEIQTTLTETLMASKDQSGLKLYWNQRRSFFMKEFREYVDELIAKEDIHESSEIYLSTEKS